MKPLKLILPILFLSSLAFGQGSFAGFVVQTPTGNAIAGASVALCTSLPNASTPCGNSTLQTTYVDITVGVQCTKNALVLGPLSGVGCTNPGYTDNFGNAQIFALGGLNYYQAWGYGISNTYVSPLPFPALTAGIGTINNVTTINGLTGGGIGPTVTVGLITSCSPNNVLLWNGATWGCSTAGTGTLTGATTSGTSGLTGGGLTGTLALSMRTDCASTQTEVWNGTSWQCGANGTGTVTGVTATSGGGLVATGTLTAPTLGLITSCGNNQVLQWNGASWVCATIAGGAGTPGGSNTQVQVNNSGAFGAYPFFTVNSGTSTVNATNLSISNQLTVAGPHFINTTWPSSPPGICAFGVGSCASTTSFGFDQAGHLAELGFNNLAGGGEYLLSTPAGTQSVIEPVGFNFSVNRIGNDRYAENFVWVQTPSGSIATGANTVTLTPCPQGISGTANGLLNAQTWIYVTSAGGDVQQPGEPVLLTGGTCTSGAASGTITFSAGYVHANGYTIGTGTAGIKEAFNDANTVRPAGNYPQGANVKLTASFVYTLKAPLFITSNKGHLTGAGLIECGVHTSCISLGDTITMAGLAGSTYAFARGNSGAFNDIILDGFWIRPNSLMGQLVPTGSQFNVAPSAPGTITGASSTATLTIPTCPARFWPLIPGQVLWLSGTNSGLVTTPYEIGFPGPGDFVQVTGGTCVPGAANGTIIVAQATPGLTNLSAHGAGYTLSSGAVPLIEDNAQGSVINNISSNGFVGQVGYGSAIQNDNNQAEYVNNFNGYGGTPRCDNDFCGAAIFGPGPANYNAGITHLIGGSMTQCANWYNGNDFWIDGAVCQGFNNAAVFMSTKRGGSVQKAHLQSVHRERGGAVNSLGTGVGAADMIVQGYNVTAGGNGQSTTNFPTFLCGGITCPNANPQQYFLSIMNTTDNTKTPPIPLGTAKSTNPNTNPVTVLFVAPDAVTAKTIKFELYRLLSGSTVLDGRVPTPALCDGAGGDGTCLVATLIDPNTICDFHGLCTYTDNLTTPTAVTPYTGIDGTGSGYFNTTFSFAPGGIVLENTSTYQGPPACLTVVSPWLNNFVGINDNGLPVSNCLPSGGSYNASLNSTFSNNANTYSQWGLLLPDRNKLNDGGNWTSLKGRVNFLGGGTYPRDITTWKDSNPAKTMGTKLEYGSGVAGTDYGTINRPLWDIGDIATGVEFNGLSLYNRVPTGGCHYWYVNTLPSTVTPGLGNLSSICGALQTFTIPVLHSTTTAAAQFLALKNTTAAVVGTSQGSPALATCGRAFHGGADVEDCVTLSELPGNGNDAAITVNIGHTGTSTGIVTTAFPGPVSAPQYITNGAAGGAVFLTQGTAPSTGTNAVGLVAPTSVPTGYNIILPTAKAGTGIPLLRGVPLALTAQVATVADTTIYTTAASGEGAGGTYRVCFNGYTTAVSGNASTVAVRVLWTDAGGAKTFVSGNIVLNAVDVTGQVNGCQTIHSAVSQAIKVGAALTGAIGTGTFGLDATVEQIQ